MPDESDLKKQFVDLMVRSVPLMRVAADLGISSGDAMTWESELRDEIASRKGARSAEAQARPSNWAKAQAEARSSAGATWPLWGWVARLSCSART